MSPSVSRSSDPEWLQRLSAGSQKAPLPPFGPGDQVRVWCRIPERDRVRLAPFEGIVIRRRGSGMSETMTVRRVTYGEGVERIFPLQAPALERIEVLKRGKVRRARLYYLRTKIGKTRIAEADAQRPTPEEPQAPESQEQPATS